jgi:hypothetical protein
VALFSNRSKAEPILERLVKAGIQADIRERFPLARLWFVSRRAIGAWLEVPPHDFERAERLLHDWDASEGALRDAIRCPECRSLQVEYPQFTENSLLTNFIIGLGAELGLVERDYYCAHCHYTWPKAGARPRRNPAHGAPYYFIEGVEQTTLAGRREPPPSEQRQAA